MNDSINLDDIVRIEISPKDIIHGEEGDYEQRMINIYRKGDSFTRIFVGGPSVTFYNERAESLFKEEGIGNEEQRGIANTEQRSNTQ